MYHQIDVTKKGPWYRSPEAIAIARANERAIVKRLAAQGTSWVCCEKCIVVDWVRKLTRCEHCKGSYK